MLAKECRAPPREAAAPAGTGGLDEAALAALVSRDALIGTARP